MRICKKISVLLAGVVLCAALAGCTGMAASSASGSGAAGESAPREETAESGLMPGQDGGTGGNTDGGTGSAPAGSEPGSMTDSGDGTPSDPAAQGGTAVQGTGLDALLDDGISYEVGSAGGSLKTAKAAAGLVELLAAGAPDDLADSAAKWRDGLDAGREAVLQANWADISQMARAIADDPAGNAELLATAGVTTDFSAMDLSGIAAGMDTLDEAFRPRK